MTRLMLLVVTSSPSPSLRQRRAVEKAEVMLPSMEMPAIASSVSDIVIVMTLSSGPALKRSSICVRWASERLSPRVIV